MHISSQSTKFIGPLQGQWRQLLACGGRWQNEGALVGPIFNIEIVPTV